jgi:hypothetical protein
MKKQSRGVFFLWILIVAIFAGGAFLLCEHLGVGAAPGAGSVSGAAAAPAGQPDANVSPDAAADGSGDAALSAAAAGPQQKFSNDGYAFSVPASWNIEKTASDTVAVHPDASLTAIAACKIEVSAFPYSAGADGMADWIAHRIGADSSLAIAEQSSEEVSFSGGTGVKWIGTIDGIPTTLVYAFSDSHAYEIAPSAVGEGANGAPQCDDMLNLFLSSLTI